jgi:hypothetical protein
MLSRLRPHGGDASHAQGTGRVLVKIPAEPLDIGPSIVDNRSYPMATMQKCDLRATSQATVCDAELRMKAARCGTVVVVVPGGSSPAIAGMPVSPAAELV